MVQTPSLKHAARALLVAMASLAIAGAAALPVSAATMAPAAAESVATAHVAATPESLSGPTGIRIKAGALANAGTGQILWSQDLNTERPMGGIGEGHDGAHRAQGGQPGSDDHGAEVGAGLPQETGPARRRRPDPGRQADRAGTARGAAAAVGLRRRVHARRGLRTRAGRVHRQDERRSPADGLDQHAFLELRRVAVAERALQPGQPRRT